MGYQKTIGKRKSKPKPVVFWSFLFEANPKKAVGSSLMLQAVDPEVLYQVFRHSYSPHGQDWTVINAVCRLWRNQLRLKPTPGQTDIARKTVEESTSNSFLNQKSAFKEKYCQERRQAEAFLQQAAFRPGLLPVGASQICCERCHATSKAPRHCFMWRMLRKRFRSARLGLGRRSLDEKLWRILWQILWIFAGSCYPVEESAAAVGCRWGLWIDGVHFNYFCVSVEAVGNSAPILLCSCEILWILMQPRSTQSLQAAWQWVCYSELRKMSNACLSAIFGFLSSQNHAAYVAR